MFEQDTISTQAQISSEYFNDYAVAQQPDLKSVVREAYHLVPAKTIFGEQTTLQTQKVTLIEAKLRPELIPDNWSANIVAPALMLYLFILCFTKSNITKLIKIYFWGYTKKNNEELTSQSFLQSIDVFSLIALFSASALCFVIYCFFNSNKSIPILLFVAGIIVASIFAYEIIKMIFIFVMKYFSEKWRLFDDVRFVERATNAIFGIFLFPVMFVALTSYAGNVKLFIIIIIALVSLLLLFKIFKVVKIFIGEKVSPFFTILYLCALEILPLWLIVDLIIQNKWI